MGTANSSKVAICYSQETSGFTGLAEFESTTTERVIIGEGTDKVLATMETEALKKKGDALAEYTEDEDLDMVQLDVLSDEEPGKKHCLFKKNRLKQHQYHPGEDSPCQSRNNVYTKPWVHRGLSSIHTSR